MHGDQEKRHIMARRFEMGPAAAESLARGAGRTSAPSNAPPTEDGNNRLSCVANIFARRNATRFISGAVRSMAVGKAPGPDGFSAEVFARLPALTEILRLLLDCILKAWSRF